MDKRKLKQIENQQEIENESLTIDDIINSKRINELLLDKAEEMFTLEFNLKQRAQLKYLQMKQKKSQSRSKIFTALSHEFLWSPTPIYYLSTGCFFMLCRKRWHLKPYTIIPFMSIPVTLDYLKREYYVSSFQEDKKKLTLARKTVDQIIQEKKKHVSFEQVFKFVFNVKFDEYIDERPLLPAAMD